VSGEGPSEGAPLLRAAAARLTVDDVVALEPFDLETTGDRLVLVGDTSPLVALVGGYPLGLAHDAALAAVGEPAAPAGSVRVVAGAVTLRGLDVAARAHVALVGAAPFEPPLPPEVTVVDWLLDAARLSIGALGGASRREIAARVSEVVGITQLGALARTKLALLPRPARRALVLAQAALSSPAVLVAELPLAGLDTAEATVVLGALEALSAGRALVVSIARLDPGSPEHGLVRRATDVACFRRGERVFFGPPEALGAGGRLYRVTVHDNAEPLRESLAATGLELVGGPTRFSLTLPEGKGPSDVLSIASEVSASVVEIVPVM
jgi:ABC-2 type transport system ATP-binding protein